MFTGLIREIGGVEGVRTGGGSRLITYSAPQIAGTLKIGDSVAVDGVCQTVTALTPRSFSAGALEATLKKTTLGTVRPGARVNLEPALALGDSLDGHIVQGHVSGTARILGVKKLGENRFLRLALPGELLAECAPEGSLAVDGISLTIAALKPGEAVMNLIPLTWETTALKFKTAGQRVNIETDPLTRTAGGAGPERALTEERLTQWGY